MSNYLFTIVDLEKPIVRKDLLINKNVIETVKNDTQNLGLLLEKLLNDIELERLKEEKQKWEE